MHLLLVSIQSHCSALEVVSNTSVKSHINKLARGQDSRRTHMGSRHQGGLSTLFRFTAPIMLCLLSVFICVQLTISEAWADNAKDTIVFTNGDRLSGKLSQATHESVKFVGDVTKVVTLQWTDIREIDLGKRTLCVIGKATAGTGNPNNFKLDKAIIRVEGRYLTVTSGPDKHRFPIDELLSAVPQVTSGQRTDIKAISDARMGVGTVQSQEDVNLIHSRSVSSRCDLPPRN